MRTIAVGVAAVSLALMLAGCSVLIAPEPTSTVAGPAGASDVALTATPSKAAYAQGEPVVLSIQVTNKRGSACRLDKLPAGSLTILSLLRDGVAVVPRLTSTTFIDGFSSFIQGNLVSIAPDASLTQTLTSEPDPTGADGAALAVSTMDLFNQASVAYWSVDQPGHYTISVGYALAAPPGDGSAACLASGDPASTTFAVSLG
jgi:hypothetical protein